MQAILIKVPPKDKNIWTKEEKKAWALPEKITVSEWADKFRILNSLTSAEPGPWRTSRTPYLKGIMDAFNDLFVEEITIMASTQIGKTESMYNMIGYVIDQDPGPALIVMPRETDAKSVSSDRVKPMIEVSPALKKHLPSLSDDITKLEYRLDHMYIYFVGSNSPAALSQRPIRYVFFDETDKYPKFSGKEADPIKLATERTRTYWNRKIVKVSTPTTKEGFIYREYLKSDQRQFYVPCPSCGKYQVLIFQQIKWPEDCSAEEIQEKRMAWYECEHCKRKILDHEKPAMIINGVWIPKGVKLEQYIKDNNEFRAFSKRAGFWISCLYSPWLTWSNIAAEFLESKDYIDTLMNFINSWLAEIWREKTQGTKSDELETLAGIYPEGVVPAGALVLTAGVDVQLDHFYIVIRGWGIGEESWLIRACKVESWEDVESIVCMTDYPSENGNISFPVRLGCVDSNYRTSEVYNFCRKWKNVLRAIRGKDHLPGAPYSISHIDRHPGTGKAIPGGLRLWNIDTSYYKDKMHRMVTAEPGDPAQWHLFANPSIDYLQQFCSEQKVIERDRKTGRIKEEWKLISQGAKNHYFDVENYAVAAADMLRVSLMRPEGERNTYRPNQVSDEKARERTAHNTWLKGKSKNWIKRG